jgi:glycosyltransferase involved in cell wall biosynthesis
MQIAERLAVDPDRIVVSHLAVDHERMRPDDDGRDAGLPAGPGLPERFVLYPANLWPHKNHRRLVEALARTSAPVELVLTGATYGRLAPLLDEATRLGVRERVRHLGYVASDAVPALYRRARALIFPSLFEGFGLPPLEAMACGCPVAASTRGSLREVCGGATLTFEPEDVASIADALDRITDDEALRARLRTAGLQRATAFTWRAARDAHVAAYRMAAG